MGAGFDRGPAGGMGRGCVRSVEGFGDVWFGVAMQKKKILIVSVLQSSFHPLPCQTSS